MTLHNTSIFNHRSDNCWVQEAQLSQRDRAMLRVIEYFAKSLKVIRNDTFEKGVS